MIVAGHCLIVLLYLVLPPLCLAVAILRGRRGRGMRIWGFILTALAGVALGVAASVVYAVALGTRPIPSQVFLACYFGISLLYLLKGFDAILAIFFRKILRVGRGQWQPNLRGQAAFWLRATVLFVVGLPYMIGAVMTYRPKPLAAAVPLLQGDDIASINFESTDGIKLAGLWIPAGRAPISESSDAWGRDTVIFCPGIWNDPTSELSMLQTFLPAGYNLLIVDFRAHGLSGGQQTTYGDLERRDVLGAVRWLRDDYPQESHRILGVGSDIGAAALIAAAADDGPDGQAIDAVAVFGVYDRISDLATRLSTQAIHSLSADGGLNGRALAATDQYFAQPLGWLSAHVGVNLASLQTGSDMADFSPVTLVERIAPRPIMVIHARHDRFAGFEQGQNVFDAAAAPKSSLWLETDGSIISESTAREIRRFFDTAVPMI